MRRPLGQAFLLGIVVGIVVALVRRATRLPAPPAGPPTLDRITPPLVPPPPAAKVAPTGPSPGGSHDEEDHPEARWVEPTDDGCPDGYPVKAKETSGIFHRPGGSSYDRTHPDRCYATPEAATADGFRPAKR